jgi:PST family polysaccharide transporter
MTQDPVSIDSDQYIKTDQLNADLQKRSRNSGLVTVASQPIKVALGIGSTAILARILTPADFGLLAMVAPLLKIVDSLANLGLETATVQREKLDHQQASAVFWLSLKINALVLGLMVLMAPVLAQFYQRNELTKITIALAVGVLSLCLTFQHKSLLKRQMRFEAITAIEVGSLLVGAICAIAAAWFGLGYWALVLQIVVMQLTQSIASWFVCGWRPAKYVKSKAVDFNLRAMVSYGAHLTGFRFLTRIGMVIDRILVGYLSGAGTLGFYAVAYQWAYFPFEQIYHPLFDVAVSSFSRTQHDPQLYRAYCRRGLMPIFAFSMPLLAFCFVAARDLILVLLGNQWLPAVPLFQVLAIAVFVGSMYRVTKWFYVSTGQTHRQLRWGLIHTPVMICAVAIGAKWGAYGIAVGYTTGICLLTYPSVAFCLKTSPLSMRDFFCVVWRPAFASIVAAILLYLTQFVLPLNHSFLSLLLKMIIFSVSYLLLWLTLGGMQLFKTSRSS